MLIDIVDEVDHSGVVQRVMMDTDEVMLPLPHELQAVKVWEEIEYSLQCCRISRWTDQAAAFSYLRLALTMLKEHTI
jgi:hypothetical protein